MALNIITEKDHGVVIDLVYATRNNLAGKIVYRQAVCALHPDAEACLNKAVIYARQAGFTLKIFDAYRPNKAQEIFWSVLADPQYVSDPSQGSNHSRGVAVDVTLLDANNKELDMGTGFDAMEDASHHTCTSLPEAVQKNRLLLLGVMLHAGFKPIASEWWHYELPNSHEYPMIESDLVTV